MKQLTKRHCTAVRRSDSKPWVWSDVARAMTSDCFKVERSLERLGRRAVNGDPLMLAYAVNFLESLYRCGYTVVDARKTKQAADAAREGK